MPPESRNPESESVEIVLLGSFNSAIFHPQWFFRLGLIGKEEADEAEKAGIKVVSSQVTDIRIGEIKILCVADRLTFKTSNVAYAEKLHDLAESVLSLLPHTPTRAAGITWTADYRVENTEYWHKIGHTLAPKELIWNELVETPGMLNLSITAPRGGDFPGTINLFVQPSRRITPGILIRANTHFDVPKESAEFGSADILKAFIHSEWDYAKLQVRLVGNKIFEKIKPHE